MPTPAEREQWRNNNADLIEFITTPVNQNRSRYINRIADSYREWSSLTEAQTQAVRRIMQEMTGEAPVATAAHAMADDAPHIPNGTFTVHDGAEHLTFKVHTVRRGPLQGKRIIKRQLSYGEFKGFAFLNHAGDGIRVWRSHVEDEARSERYIVWARILITALHEIGTDGTLPTDEAEFEFTYADGAGYIIQASVLCRRCNRALTDPTSIALRIGPECRNLEQTARTTAANAHEPVTLAQVSESSEAEQSADVILGMGVSPEEPEPVVRFINASDVSMDLNIVSPETAAIINGEVTTGTTEPPVTHTEQRLIDRIAEARREQHAWSPYGQRACIYCGRNDFRSPQGRGRHVSLCRRREPLSIVARAQQNLAEYRAQRGIVRDETLIAPSPQRRVEPPRVRRRTAPAPVTPNLSQLGTLVGGVPWEQ